MAHTTSDAAAKAIQAWLVNERRLGIGHVVRRATIAPPRASEETPERPASERDARSAAPAASLDSSASAAEALRVLDEQHVRTCTRCELHKTRRQTVFGVGSPQPEIVFVGEGPGADEDRVGEPFVGRAGQLLTRMIAAMTLTRDQVYICNVVKCRPPGNRTPTPEESAACSEYLWTQLRILRPRVIIALGRPAMQTLLATSAPISRMRGEFHDFPPPALAHLDLPPARVMPTFHPAYLLRSPNEKAKAWADLQEVMRALGIPIPTRPR
ncbi:MAG: uracil-DNA glycosylase [Planctomycetota bacterium]|nr:MAG: uracil-DNA glycosylase [Planctomycetota bacterium]